MGVLRPVSNPPNPWLSREVEYLDEIPDAKLEVYEDHTREILAHNDSPDVGFSWWKGELVVFSGVTDCYQPLEASYRLTRGCLEICAGYHNPVGIITKAPLVERDLDVLVAARASVTVSIPIWNREHAHALEPYVATPQRRMKTIERLAAAGLDVGVNVAPVIPGLSDADIPAILEAAKAAGARRAGFVFLRLPGSVAQVFEERIRRSLPLRAERILARVREARGGKLYDPRRGEAAPAPVKRRSRNKIDSTLPRPLEYSPCAGASSSSRSAPLLPRARRAKASPSPARPRSRARSRWTSRPWSPPAAARSS